MSRKIRWLIRTKHFPDSKTLPRIQKHIPETKTGPRIQNTSQNLDSGKCFGILGGVFWILASVFGFWEVFWILGSVFGFWDVFWILGRVFGFWEVFWNLGSVLSLRATVEKRHRILSAGAIQFALRNSVSDGSQCIVDNGKLKMQRRRESKKWNSLARQNNNFFNSWVHASVPRVIAGTGICK